MALPLVRRLVWLGVPLGRALCEAQETWLVFCGTVFGLVLCCVTRMTRFERLAGERPLRSDG